MLITEDRDALGGCLAGHRAAGARVGFVPTMGDLHAGHLSLVGGAAAECDVTVVSVFVNPLQFGPGEDFERYPRVPAEDEARLRGAAVDVLFRPAPATLYPRGLGDSTRVRVPGLTETLCGASRPGHFEGVATVVAMLLNLVQPDVAFFGEKDYQQLLVIRRMVADLCLPVAVRGLATVREADGLALSSRNRYLEPAQRAAAPALYRELQGVAAAAAAGGADLPALERGAAARLAAAGFAVEYLSVRDAETLEAPAPGRPQRVLGAARLGATRLIDNVPVPESGRRQ